MRRASPGSGCGPSVSSRILSRPGRAPRAAARCSQPGARPPTGGARGGSCRALGPRSAARSAARSLRRRQPAGPASSSGRGAAGGRAPPPRRRPGGSAAGGPRRGSGRPRPRSTGRSSSAVEPLAAHAAWLLEPARQLGQRRKAFSTSNPQYWQWMCSRLASAPPPRLSRARARGRPRGIPADEPST